MEMNMDNAKLIPFRYKTIGVDKKLGSNSIRTREKSFENIQTAYYTYLNSLINEMNAVMDETEKTVAQAIENNEALKDIEATVYDAALKIARLEDEVHFLTRENGPFESIDYRAIRLKNRMFKDAIQNAARIYSEIETRDKEEVKEETPAIDVEKISNDNHEKINEDIKEEIKETEEKESLGHNEITDVLSEALNDVKSVDSDMFKDRNKKAEESAAVFSDMFIDRKSKEEKQEEKIEEVKPVVSDMFEDRQSKEEKIKEEDDYEYVAMTDEEIAESRKYAEIDKYEKKYADDWAEKSGRSQFRDMFAGVSIPLVALNKVDTPLRGEVQIPSEREEKIEIEKTDEQNVEARNAVMSSEEKEKARELLEELRAARKKKEELEKESSIIDSDIENEKARNSEVSAKEEEAKRTLEESTAAANQAEEDYVKYISALKEELASLNNESDAIINGNKAKKEELASIQEDTANRHKEIESLDRENQSKQEEIAKYAELKAMLSDDEDTSEIQKVK